MPCNTTRPKYIKASREFYGMIYSYHSHGNSADMIKSAKKMREKGWFIKITPAGRPGVSVIYRRRRRK